MILGGATDLVPFVFFCSNFMDPPQQTRGAQGELAVAVDDEAAAEMQDDLRAIGPAGRRVAVQDGEDGEPVVRRLNAARLRAFCRRQTIDCCPITRAGRTATPARNERRCVHKES